MSLSWIQLPDGTTFALENQRSIEVQGSNLVLSDNAGGSTAINFGSYSAAMALLADIQAVMKAPANFTAIPYSLISIVPAAFNLSTDAITINGEGFDPATVGKLCIEDAPGIGLDSNGYYMTCTYVSPTKLTAVFGGAGDAALGPGGVFIYYQDSAGVKSNVINGTNPAGKNIIPAGATYDGSGNYSLAITAGTIAYWTMNANDLTCDGIVATGQFTASANPIVLTGQPGLAVTATVAALTLITIP